MGKPPSSQREPFACPLIFCKKKKNNFPAISLASHFVPFLISLSLGKTGGGGFLSTGVPKLSVERNAGDIRKANINAVVRGDGENRRGKKEEE